MTIPTILTRFGLQMSYAKTETMAFNGDESTKDQKSFISVNNEFRYLGHLITNTEKSSAFLQVRISSAFQKWNELKHIRTERFI